jgi:acyl-CoA synthetase (AMP-forming)/AMP-acid ligase II
MPNGIDAAIAFLATASCATAVPLNPTLSRDDFAFYLNDLQPALILTRQGFHSEISAAASDAGYPLLKLDDAACLDETEFDPFQNAFLPTPDDVGLVLYTSGTTSRPKRVPLTQSQLIVSSENIAGTLRLAPSDRCLNVMPLFHIHGLMAGLLASLRVGASVICSPGFDAEQILHWFGAFSPTWYTAVPTIHQSLLRVMSECGMKSLSPNSLRFVRSSSSAMPLRVIEELRQRLEVPVIEAYGMTEATHQISSNPLPPGEQREGSVGLPVGVDVAVLDAANRPLPSGVVGQIALRGATITAGYEENTQSNAEAFQEGWFRTGDEGNLDEDGYLYLTGRAKEMINRGGEKISPIEIDNALMEHPAVERALAFAIPHPTLGEDLGAAVTLRSGYEVTETHLRAYLFQHLAEFKIPSQIVVVDKIPQGSTGKAQRIGLASKLRHQLRPEFVPPQTVVQEAVLRIWQEVLHIDGIGIGDNFFAVGGDSLSATRFISRVNSQFGLRMSLRSAFETPRLVDFAQRIEEEILAEIEGQNINEDAGR